MAVVLPNVFTLEMVLEGDELITFKNSDTEYDFSKKNWGYYSTPSINSRLNYYGFDVFLVKNKIDGKYFIFSNPKKLG